MKTLVLGSSGMAGHTIAIYMAERGHDVTGIDLRKFRHTSANFNQIAGNIVEPGFLENIIVSNRYDGVINCVGLLNEDAENNKHLSVYLNSYLPHLLVHLTQNSNTKVIQMSTDCVFSGKSGNYREDSLKDGESFYDRTKSLGEIVNPKDLTFRNSIVGPDINSNGIGLFNWFMKQNDEIEGYSRVIWTGVTTLTLAKAMEKALEENLRGLYNLVNNQKISKFDLLRLFSKHFNKRGMIIRENSDICLDKSLVNNRKDFDFRIPSYDQMIREMKEWIDNHQDFYPHYFKSPEMSN